jgi:hypothetical protein
MRIFHQLIARCGQLAGMFDPFIF